MIRPCVCNNVNKCRLCWLYHNDIRYRKLWSEPLQLPSKLEQAANAIKALGKRINDNFTDVSDDDYNKRLAICENCPNKTEDWRCAKCGCYLTIKAKWRTEECPENRWPLNTLVKDKGCGCASKK